MEDAPYNRNRLLPPEQVEAFEKLFSIESAFTIPRDYLQNKSARVIREYAVFYIETLSNCKSFDASVPYFAMSNLDRFLSKSEIPTVIFNKQENINLFVVSCLTIAWKMRLKSFDICKFLSERGLKFGRKGVMRMELIILNSLEWRMRSLTPLCFVGYLIRLLPLPQNLTRRPARQIIVWTQADIVFTKFSPSTLAASAILCASSKLFPARYSEIRSVILSCRSFSQGELSESVDRIETMFEAKLRSLTDETSTGARLRTSQPPMGTTGEASSSLPPGATACETSSSRTAGEGIGDKSTQEGHRSGKEPAVEKDSDTIVEMEKVPGPEPAPAGSDDSMMDFKLEWIDPTAPKPEILFGGLGRCSFVDALAKCWPIPILEAQQETWRWLHYLLDCGNRPNRRRRHLTMKEFSPVQSSSDSSFIFC